MQLRLLLTQVQRSSPVESEYAKSTKFQVNILDESIPYVFCSQKFLDQYAGGSRIGYVEDHMIFISKGLHPTAVPFAALQLFYKSLDKGELAKRFGDAFNTLNADQGDNLLMTGILSEAKRLMLPGAYQGYISLQPQYIVSDITF